VDAHKLGDLDAAKDVLPIGLLTKWAYRQMSGLDRFFVVVALFCSLGTGICWPINSYIFPEVIGIILGPVCWLSCLWLW
jgi:hypothetical protein